MPLVNEPQPVPENPKDTPIKVDVENDVAVVDTDFEHLGALNTYIAGSVVRCAYYSSVLGKDDITTPHEGSLDPSIQQYKKIENFELKLQGQLDVNIDPQTQARMLEGEAIVTPGTLVPNKGDMLLLDVGQGRAGLFSVSEVRTATIFKGTAYTINFRLIRFIDSQSDSGLTDLENKVVENYEYIQDLLGQGKEPVIQVSAARIYRKLKVQRTLLLEYYLNTFYSREKETLFLPDQLNRVYDPMVTKTLLRIYNTNEHPDLRDIRELNTDAVPELDYTTIWDCLLSCRSELLPTISRKAEIMGVGMFYNNPALINIAYMGVDKIIVPRSAYSVDRHESHRTLLSFKDFLPNPPTKIDDLTNHTGIDPGEPQLQDTPLVRELSGYLFNEEVYTSGEVSSRIESLVVSYFNGTGLNQDDLLDLAERAYKWPWIEGFYYIPVLMILINSAVRGR